MHQHIFSKSMKQFELEIEKMQLEMFSKFDIREAKALT